MQVDSRSEVVRGGWEGTRIKLETERGWKYPNCLFLGRRFRVARPAQQADRQAGTVQCGA